MHRFWLIWEAFSLVGRNRGAIPAVLTAAEELALVHAIAEPQDLRDIEALDPRLYRALLGVTQAIMPSMPIRVIEGRVAE